MKMNSRETMVLGSYKGEPIEWLVLDSDGNNKLLISKMALDAIPYNENREDTTWEKCTLRKWLNNEFLNEALSEYKDKIVLTKVTADKNPEFDTDPGNDTQDKVFLLSIDEVNKYFDIPDDDDEEYQDDEHYVGDATCIATEYAKTTELCWLGCDEEDEFDENDADYGSCMWWLRSPGYSSESAAFVRTVGSVHYPGIYVSRDDGGVRPALWINLES